MNHTFRIVIWLCEHILEPEIVLNTRKIAISLIFEPFQKKIEKEKNVIRVD